MLRKKKDYHYTVDYASTFPTGTSESASRQSFCHALVDEWFGKALGAIFVRDHLSDRSRAAVGGR